MTWYSPNSVKLNPLKVRQRILVQPKDAIDDDDDRSQPFKTSIINTYKFSQIIGMRYVIRNLTIEHEISNDIRSFMQGN